MTPLAGTEEVYFAVSHLDMDGGIEVTASHNPVDNNGMKLVREQSKPISGDSGLHDIKHIAEEGLHKPVDEVSRGSYRAISTLDAYVEHLLGYIEISKLSPLKLVVNAGK